MSLRYKFRIYLISSVAVLIIVLAVAFSVVRAFLPYATDYTQDVEAKLSQRIGLPVTMTSFDADMRWFTPRLKLLNIVVHDATGKKELLILDELILSLSYIETLRNFSPRIGDINLLGADLFIEKHPDNLWKIQGVEIVGGDVDESTGDATSFINNTSFSLLDSDLHWRDFTGDKEPMDFIGVNLVVESFAGGHAIEVDMQLPEGYGDRIQLIATTDSKLEAFESADWEIYIEGLSIEIKNWLKKFSFPGDLGIEGEFDGRVWLDLSASELNRLSADFSIKQTALIDEKNRVKPWRSKQISALFDWVKSDKGWSLKYKNLALLNESGKWASASSGEVSVSEQLWRAEVDYFRATNLIELANFIVASQANDDQQSAVKDYFAMNFQGDFYDTTLLLDEAELSKTTLQTGFVDLALEVPGKDITFQGLDGELSFQDGQAKLDLMSDKVIMDFGKLFRQPLKARLLEGELMITEVDAGWQVSSPHIYMINADIETRTRLDININPDAEILIDLQTDFNNAKGAAAHRYYPVSIMSEGLVGWLDKSISDGKVDQGSFILYGDTASFPFGGNEGVMEVAFDVRDMSLDFLKGWPVINELGAHLRFYDSSLAIENATGRSYSGRMKNVYGSIADFNVPELRIHGDINAPADDVQNYIWNSGLDEALGDFMRQLDVLGNVDIGLSLDIPLSGENTTVKTQGDIIFNRIKIGVPVMQYVLDDVSGTLSFTESTLFGSNIFATFMGDAVNIGVNTTGDEFDVATVFSLTGLLSIDGLLSRFDGIPDQWLSGRSKWDVVLSIPKNLEQNALRVKMNSELQGVEVNVSKSVHKDQDVVMPVTFDVQMLPDTLQLDLNSENMLSVFATRDEGLLWDFIVDSEYIRGSGEFDEALDIHSRMHLNLERANLYALFDQGEQDVWQDSPVMIKPAALPSLDIKIKHMQWNDWDLKNVDLVTSGKVDGMLVEKINLQTKFLDVKGSGDWMSSWGNTHESSFKFNINSGDFGQALADLGFTDRLLGASESASVHMKWPAEPYKFSLDKVSGNAHIKLTEGEVKDVEQGAGGRLLGLFNVFKLGERLKLNFSDVYRQGFLFDLVEGDFKFEAGSAVTHNIELNASAADIKMQGRIGLVKQDYDLMMKVAPHSSAAAFTGGTLAAGPVIGTTLVVINKLLRLDKLVYDEYKVTGSWDNPNVTQISKRNEDTDVVEDNSDYE